MSSWSHPFSVLAPSLPDHCDPESQFLNHFSSAFHTCVPTELAFISTLLGTLSIVSWLFAQLPQIYKNYSIKSTSGLSIYFLVEWCLGDVSNLLGAVFTGQATWQVIIAGYYCFVDFMLVAQWLWYERLQHGNRIRLVWPSRKSRDLPQGDDSGDGGMQQVVIEGVPALSRQTASGGGTAEGGEETRKDSKSAAKDIRGGGAPRWHVPDFEKPGADESSASSPSSGRGNRRTIHRSSTTQPSSSFPYSPSPRTILLLACLLSLAHASPLSTPYQPTTFSTSSPISTSSPANTAPTPLETAGTALSWISTSLYLLSRLPQLYKNFSRKSTSGLSPHLFLAAFFGNLFYSTSLLSNPNLWSSAPAHGLRGWAGADGNDAVQWMAGALPFWLGAAGVLGLDGAVGVQFLVYGGVSGDEAPVVVVRERAEGSWRWRRVSGWMRGWVPSFSEPRDGGGEEERGLLGGAGGREYGGVGE